MSSSCRCIIVSYFKSGGVVKHLRMIAAYELLSDVLACYAVDLVAVDLAVAVNVLSFSGKIHVSADM